MGYILLVVFPLSTFSVFVDTLSECTELGQLNQMYWHETGQLARAVCMKSFEV